MAGTIMSFEPALKDPATPVALDFNAGRNVLLLAFGGFARQVGFPMFEFDNMTKGRGSVNRIFPIA